ncbi:MAG TPA: potassium-transporting ATPase subunit KdpC [bacterium]|nr:potassium-transporting ATPase subunit KdpC [bacterium]
MKNIRICIMVFVLLTMLSGIIYPAAVTAVARLFFAEKANGSLIIEGKDIRGSMLIGQKFTSARYFHSRPSSSDYSPLPSSASNLGPTSALLRKQVEQRRKELAPYVSGKAPADLLTASGSGLDPDISPEAAIAQIDSVAVARNLSPKQKELLSKIVRRRTEGPQLRIFGAPRVNVLKLNLDIDRAYGKLGSTGDNK